MIEKALTPVAGKGEFMGMARGIIVVQFFSVARIRHLYNPLKWQWIP
jgi:hypothetical protein